jgi:hypothetical protein
MLLWAYFAAVTTDPGRVPPGWHPFQDEQVGSAALPGSPALISPSRRHPRRGSSARALSARRPRPPPRPLSPPPQQARAELERMAYSDYYYDRRDPRRPRYCKRCQAWKPERTHHCSVSGHCVLKMDHYCIWVVNCVGLLNYKHFLLFLWYTFWASLAAVALLVQPMLEFFTRDDRGGCARGAGLLPLLLRCCLRCCLCCCRVLQRPVAPRLQGAAPHAAPRQRGAAAALCAGPRPRPHPAPPDARRAPAARPPPPPPPPPPRAATRWRSSWWSRTAPLWRLWAASW